MHTFTEHQLPIYLPITKLFLYLKQKIKQNWVILGIQKCLLSVFFCFVFSPSVVYWLKETIHFDGLWMKTSLSDDSVGQSVGNQNILSQRGGTTAAVETKLRFKLPAVGKVPLMKIVPRGSGFTVGWTWSARPLAGDGVDHGPHLLWQVSTQYYRLTASYSRS